MEHLSRAAGVSHANYKIAYKTDCECHIVNVDVVWMCHIVIVNVVGK